MCFSYCSGGASGSGYLSRAEVQEVFARVRRQQPVTAVLVTHDLSEALRLADRVAVLRAGRLEQLGTPRDVVHDPASAYVRELIERARSSWPEELR